MSKRRIFYIVFFSVLVVGFFVSMSFLIPGFAKPTLPPIGYVAPYTFINQDGKAFSEKEAKGKVVAAEFFFTTCKGICPKMNNNMRLVYDKYKDEDDFLILSHTSDPGTDSAARLKHYADSMGVDTKRWVFLTGRKDSLYSMARHSYKIDDPKNHVKNVDDDFLHSQFIALVNKRGEVVRIYDALKESEMKEMINDIPKLLKETADE